MRIELRYKYVHSCKDRHGNVRVYFRRRVGACKIRLKETPGTPAFDLEYQLALAAGQREASKVAPIALKKGTLKSLVSAYLSSSWFLRLHPVTQRRRRRQLNLAIDERPLTTSPVTFADIPVWRLTSRHLNILLERKALSGGPDAANNLLKAFRGLFGWARHFEHIDKDPSRELARRKTKGDGFRPWTNKDISQFRAHYPVGTLARAVLEISYCAGLRRSDIVRLGRQHVVNGVIRLSAFKNLAPLTVPILAELAEALDALPKEHLIFVTTQYGKPFSAAGLGNWFRGKCDDADLHGLSLHGLRKAFATRLAENGASEHQLMALAGWSNPKEAQRYTKAANLEVLSKAGMSKLGTGKGTETSPPASANTSPLRKMEG